MPDTQLIQTLVSKKNRLEAEQQANYSSKDSYEARYDRVHATARKLRDAETQLRAVGFYELPQR